MLISSYLSINALFDGYLKQHLKLHGIRKQRLSRNKDLRSLLEIDCWLGSRPQTESRALTEWEC